MKSPAFSSGGRTSSALARAAFSPPSAASRSRIWAATSLSGLREAGRISSACTAWKPNGVRTGSALISPFFSAKSACSNWGTMSPLLTQPRSPPLSLEPGSSDISRASLPRSSPALARLIASATFARARSSASLPPVSPTRISRCTAVHLGRRLELLDVLGVVLLDLGVADLRRHVLGHDRHVLDLPALGLLELVGVALEVLGHLVGAGGGRGRPAAPARPSPSPRALLLGASPTPARPRGRSRRMPPTTRRWTLRMVRKRRSSCSASTPRTWRKRR